MEDPTRALAARSAGPKGPPHDESASRCARCAEPIAKGEGRYRLTTLVYHVQCWETCTEDPVADPRRYLSDPRDMGGGAPHR